MNDIVKSVLPGMDVSDQPWWNALSGRIQSLSGSCSEFVCEWPEKNVNKIIVNVVVVGKTIWFIFVIFVISASLSDVVAKTALHHVIGDILFYA